MNHMTIYQLSVTIRIDKELVFYGYYYSRILGLVKLITYIIY